LLHSCAGIILTPLLLPLHGEKANPVSPLGLPFLSPFLCMLFRFHVRGSTHSDPPSSRPGTPFLSYPDRVLRPLPISLLPECPDFPFFRLSLSAMMVSVFDGVVAVINSLLCRTPRGFLINPIPTNPFAAFQYPGYRCHPPAENDILETEFVGQGQIKAARIPRYLFIFHIFSFFCRVLFFFSPQCQVLVIDEFSLAKKTPKSSLNQTQSKRKAFFKKRDIILGVNLSSFFQLARSVFFFLPIFWPRTASPRFGAGFAAATFSRSPS